MYIDHHSGKMLLFGVLLLLTSCSGGGKNSGPSLNADKRWSWLVAQRERPLPVAQNNLSGNNSAKTEDKIPVSSPPLSVADVRKQRKILQMAAKEYHDIAASLDSDIRQKARTVKKADGRVLWQTMQLHFSRLVSLQKNMALAITALGTATGVSDKTRLDRSRKLMANIIRRIDHTRKYLDNFNPDK